MKEFLGDLPIGSTVMMRVGTEWEPLVWCGHNGGTFWLRKPGNTGYEVTVTCHDRDPLEERLLWVYSMYPVFQEVI